MEGTILLNFLLLLLQLISYRGTNSEAITVKALYKACNPDALIPECGKNAICARVPRCQLGVCVCRFDGFYQPSLRNVFDCEEPPRRQPTMCELIQGEIDREKLSRFSLGSSASNNHRSKRGLCGDDDHRPSSSSKKQSSVNRQQLSAAVIKSGKLLDKNEDCSRDGSKCNSFKGLTCDSSARRCNCQWPNLEKHDGTCYTAGYGETCMHNHECDWMYRGTMAGNTGNNAVCDDATNKCRCNNGYVVVPRIGVNYFLPLQKQTGPIEVSVYNISVLLSTQGTNIDNQLSTNYVCLKESSKPRVVVGGSCSYLLTMVSDPLLCDAGLVCQYCPQEKDDGHRQVTGTCVAIDPPSSASSETEKAVSIYAERGMSDVARILICVGAVVATVIIAVAVFFFWRRHNQRMRSWNVPVRPVRCQHLGDKTATEPLTSFPIIGAGQQLIHNENDQNDGPHFQQQQQQQHQPIVSTSEHYHDEQTLNIQSLLLPHSNRASETASLANKLPVASSPRISETSRV